jgi:hypothetical protein
MPDFLLDGETIRFLVSSRGQTGEISQLSELLTAPQDFAERYAIPLSASVEGKLTELGAINESKGFAPEDEVNREVMSFFNKVMIDGRFIEQWVNEPISVAEQLGIQVSEEASQRIQELELSTMVDSGLIADPGQVDQALIGIVIVIVLVVVFVLIPSCLTYSIAEVIVDPSSMDKV